MNRLGPINVGGSNPVRIMGILNLSPESFHKKSIKTTQSDIIDTVHSMECDGADFIDLGGASTAPYIQSNISAKIESKRITDAIKIVQRISNIPISVDTCKSSVAKHALDLGVEIINDISGLKYDHNMINVIRNYDVFVILTAFSKSTITGNHLIQTKKLLQQSLYLARSIGISKDKIALDPGIGFFRKHAVGELFTKIDSCWLSRDISIIRNLKSIKLNQPMMISVSNKSFIGELLHKTKSEDRLFGSIAAEVISVCNGADIIRTHNVSETKDAIAIAEKLIKS